ncbi:MAG: magnesium transporter [Lachnospiraceae bacterium]|nr:magnesium transporter [Lachnospiraceae bacterium]
MTDALEKMKDSIEKLAEGKKYATLRDILSTMNAADLAALLEETDEAQLPLLFRLLPKELAADTFVEMSPEEQELLIRSFSDSELKEVVDELYVDDAADLVEEMPANVVKRILTQADPEKRRMINNILKYPDDCAGSIMTTEFVELRPHMTVEEAILRIRRSGIDKETINTCYVTEKDRKLIGMITIRDLILSESDDVMTDIMEDNVISVNTMEDQEAVAQAFSKYDLLAMPVVDTENRLVGIVTVDDVLDVLEEETTEDIEKMAAIMPTAKPYFRQTTFDLWKSRIPWLLLLMISATFTGMIITSFEGALAKYVILTAYIPMLMDTGGNSGGQSSVTIIRAISLGEIEFNDIFRVIWKELKVALVCGLTLAVCNFAKLMLFDGVGFTVSMVICLTLVVTIFCAKLVGCTLPIIAKRIGFDPAVMASPFITTIVDAISLLVYFQFATRILGI